MTFKIGDKVEVISSMERFIGTFKGQSEYAYWCWVVQRDDDPNGNMGGGQYGWYNVDKGDDIIILIKAYRPYEKLLDKYNK